MIYWNRLIDPRTPGKREFLLQHDGQIVRALQSALQIQPSDFQAHTATQLSLPANLGGPGLSSQERLSPIAFASSIAMCSGAMYERLSRRRFSIWLAEPHLLRDVDIIAHACEDWSSMVAQIIRMDPTKEASFLELTPEEGLVPLEAGPVDVGAQWQQWYLPVAAATAWRQRKHG